MAARRLIIVNPISASGRTARTWPAVQDALAAAGGEFDVAFTERHRHAIELAQQAAASGYSDIVAVGGDGTVQQVVTGIVRAGKAAEVTLAVIPGGTGSDLTRMLGWRRGLADTVQRVLAGPPAWIDLGRLTSTTATGPETAYFANVLGLGFAGAVIERVERSSKALGGTIPYLTSLVTTLFTYRNLSVRVVLDGQVLEQVANAVVVANGRYFGGGMFVAPDASLEDGLFDVIIVGDMGKLELLANTPRLYKGTHLSHPKVSHYRAREVIVEAQGRFVAQADGELWGIAPVAVSIVPQALHLRGYAHSTG
jgi:YegS/Rv2252/BmrU family lipid kinase